MENAPSLISEALLMHIFMKAMESYILFVTDLPKFPIVTEVPLPFLFGRCYLSPMRLHVVLELGLHFHLLPDVMKLSISTRITCSSLRLASSTLQIRASMSVLVGSACINNFISSSYEIVSDLLVEGRAVSLMSVSTVPLRSWCSLLF